MKLDEYLRQESGLRTDVHFHNGVWWKKSSFGTCYPLYQLQEIIPNKSRPEFKKSFIRYYHAVPPTYNTDHRGSGYRKMQRMMIQDGTLQQYSFNYLSDRKRRQAINRAARRGFTIEIIQNLSKFRSDMHEIYITNAERNKHGRHQQWYIENEARWWMDLEQEWSLPGRDWFGAFLNDKLIAFLYSCLVDSTAVWLVAKSNKNYLNSDPNDLLWHETINYYKSIRECSRIDAGWSIAIPPTIDWRKKSFGFESSEITIYDKINHLAIGLLQSALWMAKPFINSSIGYNNRRGLLFKARTIKHLLDSYQAKETHN